MLDSYLKYLSYEKRFSPHTISAYRNDVEQFQEFLENEFDGIPLHEVNHQLIRSWIISLVEMGRDEATVNRKVASLKSYYKFLLKHSYIDQDPSWKVRPLKKSARIPQFVNEVDILNILDNSEFSDEFTGRRERMVLELLYGTGIRLSEMLNLQDKDISGGAIRVLGKRNKERIIPLPAELQRTIKGYQAARNRDIGPSDYLIVTDEGKQAYPMLVYRIVNSYLSRYTTLDTKSPHVLRHTFATHLLNKGADLNAVKDLLGHSSLAATQVYTHNTIEKLKETFQQAHPKA